MDIPELSTYQPRTINVVDEDAEEAWLKATEYRPLTIRCYLFDVCAIVDGIHAAIYGLHRRDKWEAIRNALEEIINISQEVGAQNMVCAANEMLKLLDEKDYESVKNKGVKELWEQYELLYKPGLDLNSNSFNLGTVEIGSAGMEIC
ncbi:unnamed protein product [Cuscuta campestris]|uniref:Uncharacterized protein n=1 Tax=Cuscuta campestris TaxID=132261 RepID=A0A484LH49_9ASTE|nr:unnamed protein product [Cuscuta campestris]